MLAHPLINDGWFKERESELWPGQAMCLKVKQILHVSQSKFQDVLVFESTNFGNVLALDGCIQVTERDEFSYQEMITHLAMMAHPNPRNILVVGGGDGGVLREVVKHDIDKVTLVDIDEQVIQMSKKFLPSLSVGFQHPKTEVFIGDGFEFLKQNTNKFDVVITDSSDPVGPAESLFQKPFYDLINKSLKPNGVMSCQGECMWLHLDLIKQTLDSCREIFGNAEYAYTTIPTYPSGQIGFIIASNGQQNLKVPQRHNLTGCRYYSPQIHEAAFVLPEFAIKKL